MALVPPQFLFHTLNHLTCPATTLVGCSHRSPVHKGPCAPFLPHQGGPVTREPSKREHSHIDQQFHILGSPFFVIFDYTSILFELFTCQYCHTGPRICYPSPLNVSLVSFQSFRSHQYKYAFTCRPEHVLKYKRFIIIIIIPVISTHHCFIVFYMRFYFVSN